MTVAPRDDADGADARTQIAHTVSGPGAWGSVAAPAVTVLVTDDDGGAPGAGETVTVTAASDDPGAARVRTGSGALGASVALAFAAADWSEAQTVTVTVWDDDGAFRPLISIAPDSNDAVTEGGGAGFTLTASRAPAADLAVTVEVADAPASDFVAGAGEGARTVTITAGRRSAGFTVQTQPDADDEPNGAVTATVVSGSRYRVHGTRNVAQARVDDDDATTVTLTGSADAIAENGGVKTLTFALGRALVKGESANVRLHVGGTARRSSNYRTRDYAMRCVPATGLRCHLNTDPPQIVFIGSAHAAPEAAIEVVAIPDEHDEGTGETVTVSVGPIRGDWGIGLGGGVTGTGSVRFTIADGADLPVTVSIAAGTSPVTEGADAGFTLNASRAPLAALPVNVDVTDAPGSDFVAGSGEGRRTVTIPAGRRSVDFTVTTEGDSDAEADGPVTAALAAGSGYALGSPTSAAVTVTDDDRLDPGVTVSKAALALTEGGAAGTYTVVLTAPPGAGETVTVTATVADATAAHVRTGSGSLAASAALSFTGGDWNSAQTVTVSPRDDADTGNESTQIDHTVSGPGAWGSVTATPVAVTVTDDDPAPLPVVSIEAEHPGSEGAEGTEAGFVLSADRAPVSNLAVQVTVADAPGADFIAQGQEGTRTVTFQAGLTSTTLRIPTLDDADDEPSGAVTATLLVGAGYLVDDAAATAGSGIYDDAATTVTLAGPAGDIAEADGAKAFTVTLGRGLRAGEALDVPLAYGGTATRGTDYTTTCPSPLPAGVACHDLDDVAAGANPRVTFTGPDSGATAASVTLTLTPVDDTADEGAGETVTVALGAFDADSGTGLDGGAAGTGSLAFAIEDDDVPALSVAAASAEAVTEGTAAGFTVNADPAPAADLAVTVMVADASASDFLAATEEGERTVTVLAGETSAAFTVATQLDNDDEPNGAVTATLGEGDGYTVDADAGSAAADVADDDATAVTLASPAGNIDEDRGTKTFTVTLARALVAGEALEVPLVLGGDADNGDDYAVTCATAKGVACSGLDGNTPRVAFTGGAGAATVATLTLASIDDETDEGAGEPVTVDLGTLDADSGTGLGGGASGTGALAFTITDDDLPPPVVTTAVSPASMVEGGRATFTVSADRAPDAALAVPVTVTDAPGADFIAQAHEGRRTVTIAAGTTSAAFAFTTDDDAVDEPDGPVTATLAAGAGYTLGSPASASVAVSDDDAATLPTLSIADAEAEEGKQLRFIITLSAPLDRDVRFTVRFQESSPVSARANYDWDTWNFCQCAYDFLVNRFQVTLPRGETQAHRWVTTIDDAHDEGDETFEGRITYANVPIADGVTVGTIRNDAPLPAAWLARFGRTVASHAVDAIADRMAAPRSPGMEGALAGQALPAAGGGGTEEHGAAAGGRRAGWAPGGIARGFGGGIGRSSGGIAARGLSAGGLAGTDAEGRSMTGREALLQSRFALTGTADASGGTLALWGRAAQGRFDGVERGDGTDIRLDGEVTTTLLGADYARGKWLAGLALARSEAEGEYASEGAAGCPPGAAPDSNPGAGGETPALCHGAVRAGDGRIEGSLTAAIPWAAVRAPEGLRLWGAAGYGSGRVTIRTAMGGRYTAGTTWTMAAAGLRGELLGASGSGPSLALTSDALWARTSSERTRELAPSDSDATRLRLGLEAGWRVALEGGASLVPKLETGLRHDGGDAETGFGVELGGGLAWSDPGLGLSIDLSGRALLAHEDGDLKDRGYAAHLSFDPRPSSGRGLSLSLGHEFGARAESGLDALFAPDPLEDRRGSEAASRWTAEAAYGLPALGGRFTGSPHAGLGLARGARDWTLGWRLTPEGPTALDL